jgi:hypothetical protein
MFFTSSQARESARANRRLAAQAQAFRDTQDTWFNGTVASVDRRIASCQRILHAAQSALGRSPFDIEPLQILSELQDDHRALTGVRHDLLTGYRDRVAYDEDYGPEGPYTDMSGWEPPEHKPIPPMEETHPGWTRDEWGRMIQPAGGTDPYARRQGAIWKTREERDEEKKQRDWERQQDSQRVRRGLEKAYGPKAAAVLAPDERRWAILQAPRFVRANLDASFHRDELATRANHWAAKVTSGFDHPAETRQLFVSAVLDEARGLPRPQLRPRLGNRKIIDIEPEAIFL